MKPRGRSPLALTQPILLPNASLSTLAYSELSDTLDRMFLCLLYLMQINFHPVYLVSMAPKNPEYIRNH